MGLLQSLMVASLPFSEYSRGTNTLQTQRDPRVIVWRRPWES